MAIRAKDVYQGSKKRGSRAGHIVLIILIVLAVLIGVFYALRACCVYDKDGNATIVLPFSDSAAASGN